MSESTVSLTPDVVIASFKRAEASETRESSVPQAPDVIAERAEESTTNEAVMGLLKSHNAKFGTLTHAPTRTSEESASVRGVPLATGAKAMLLKASKALPHGSPFLLVVLSAARKADLRALRGLLNQKSVSMASVEDVWRLTRCIPGAVPPFGSLFEGVATYADTSITELPAINFNAGLRTHSVLHLAVEDYLAIEKPTVLSFSLPME